MKEPPGAHYFGPTSLVLQPDSVAYVDKGITGTRLKHLSESEFEKIVEEVGEFYDELLTLQAALARRTML